MQGTPARSLAAAPLWLRLAFSGLAALLIAYYAHRGAWQNFFWLSDISLFLTAIALWGTSPLLNSMLAIGVLPFELYWNAAFFMRAGTGIEIGEIPDYMFDARLPLLLRTLSLFHVVLPVVWMALLARWRYDPRALKAQTVLLWAIVAATYRFTSPALNINWVFVPHRLGLQRLPEHAWLAAYLVLVPAVVYWPMHKLCSRWFR